MVTESDYKTFILRVWQVDRDEKMVVVALLEDSITNQRTSFASLSALMAFLEKVGATRKSRDEI